MRKVTIYTTDYCGYCTRAKSLLERQGVPYEEHDVTGDRAKRIWLRDRTGRATVPQIFFDDESVGGCDELERIIRGGALMERLKAASSAR